MPKGADPPKEPAITRLLAYCACLPAIMPPSDEEGGPQGRRKGYHSATCFVLTSVLGRPQVAPTVIQALFYRPNRYCSSGSSSDDAGAARASCSQPRSVAFQSLMGDEPTIHPLDS